MGFSTEDADTDTGEHNTSTNCNFVVVPDSEPMLQPIYRFDVSRRRQRGRDKQAHTGFLRHLYFSHAHTSFICTRVYGIRWIMLIMYALLTMINAVMWISFASVQSQTAFYYFHGDTTTASLNKVRTYKCVWF